MKLYKIILTVFGFGLFVTASNSMGIFGGNVPIYNTNSSVINQATITQLEQTQGSNSGIYALYHDVVDPLWWIGQSIKIILDSIGAVLGIGGTLQQYGIPTPIVGMIISMLVLVAAYGLVMFATGRMGKGME